MDSIMIEKEYEYQGYTIEIHNHPIYHDYEFVVKNDDGIVVMTSTHTYENSMDAEAAAEIYTGNL